MQYKKKEKSPRHKDDGFPWETACGAKSERATGSIKKVTCKKCRAKIKKAHPVKNEPLIF